MSRRRGQSGNVFQQGQTGGWNTTAPCYGRFWIDSADGRKRKVISLGVCETKTTAKRKLRQYIETEGINRWETFVESSAPGTTFREQAEKWIADLPNRRRRPLKPATVAGYRHALDKWILPTLGDRLLSEVSNGALKELIDVMAAGGLSPKSIVLHAAVVRLVVASALTADGEPVYPRKWNNEFCGLPIVNKEKQRRPTVSKDEVVNMTEHSTSRFSVLFALLAGSGLRIGEALALKPLDFSPDFRTVHITRSIWRGKEQNPKTPAAVRFVDIPEQLAALLRSYAAKKAADQFLFATKSGKPLGHRNVLRAAGVGLHALRRFRAETLRRAGVPRDIEQSWLGHAKETVGDFYAAGLENDQQRRREWCERAGLGFGLIGAINRLGLALPQPAQA
jgi:integrase